jgi:hypothetical protein
MKRYQQKFLLAAHNSIYGNISQFVTDLDAKLTFDESKRIDNEASDDDE